MGLQGLYLIQEQDAGILDKSTGDGNALLLPSRQLDASRPQLRYDSRSAQNYTR